MEAREDGHAGLRDGAPLTVRARTELFTPYPYQLAAVKAFTASGHGVVVLPCGAGKTVVGLLAMEALATRTLVLTSSREAALQWKRELCSKSELASDRVAVYEGARDSAVGPVTVATYARGADRAIPEIALEVIVTHGAIDKLEVYRGLGVREVWLYEAGAFKIVALRDDRYELIATSEVLPEADLARIAFYAKNPDQHSALRAFRDELRAQR